MLPFFALLLFALLGIGALVIDGGLALTEQARLETASEMMVAEWAYVKSLPDADLPGPCAAIPATPSDRRDECLQVAFLTPLITPLGLDLANQGPTDRWRRADAALDGTRIDPRGARLGALRANGVLDGSDPSTITLTRSSPLLFGWAAIRPQTEGGTGPDVLTRRAAHDAQGLAPDLGGRGLYGEGFSLSASASLGTNAPAMQVGRILRDASGAAVSGGFVGLAWRAEAIPNLDFTLFPFQGAATSLALNRVDATGPEIEATVGGSVVACLFDVDPAVRTLRMGGELDVSADPMTPLSTRDARTAYVPIVDADESCLPTGAGGRIFGFLELDVVVDAGTDTLRVQAIGPTRRLRRNASSLPPAIEGALDDARQAWTNGAGLHTRRAWREGAVTLPRVESTIYPAPGGAS